MLVTKLHAKTKDNIILVETYSTENKYILKENTTIKYVSAIDLGILDSETGCYRPKFFNYIETDETIEGPIHMEDIKNETRK